jgi:hypothetical protein
VNGQYQAPARSDARFGGHFSAQTDQESAERAVAVRHRPLAGYFIATGDRPPPAPVACRGSAPTGGTVEGDAPIAQADEAARGNNDVVEDGYIEEAPSGDGLGSQVQVIRAGLGVA